VFLFHFVFFFFLKKKKQLKMLRKLVLFIVEAVRFLHRSRRFPITLHH